ncbi:MAG: mechanosensitive ion channel domain-containing protein, partial [Planctomycetaceae bacterium]
VTLHRVEPVTVANLALAVLVVVLTFVAAGNLPGLIELLLLKRLPLDAGLRYAISSLARYSLVLVGLFLACYTVRISWSNVQWLAAALTFGLGFGLQEIFANFVSGLIILFERPVRVGDVVTIEGVSGVVTRIRIRATTITDWDRKEFIVPNKEFITGRLLNWTLSDQMNRIVINVGVAYGSDVEKARELLLQAAREQPAILADPAPMATFEGFGDSALNLVLRAYLPTMDSRLQVIHELHSRIHVLFREAGIEIPFPQHDLHVRSLDESLVPFMRRRRKPAAVGANGNGKD